MHININVRQIFVDLFLTEAGKKPFKTFYCSSAVLPPCPQPPIDVKAIAATPSNPQTLGSLMNVGCEACDVEGSTSSFLHPITVNNWLKEYVIDS